MNTAKAVATSGAGRVRRRRFMVQKEADWMLLDQYQSSPAPLRSQSRAGRAHLSNQGRSAGGKLPRFNILFPFSPRRSWRASEKPSPSPRVLSVNLLEEDIRNGEGVARRQGGQGLGHV